MEEDSMTDEQISAVFRKLQQEQNGATKVSLEVQFSEKYIKSDRVRVKYEENLHIWKDFFWKAIPKSFLEKEAARFLGAHRSVPKIKNCVEMVRIDSTKIKNTSKLKRNIIPTLGEYIEISSTGQVEKIESIGTLPEKEMKEMGFTYYVNGNYDERNFRRNFEGSVLQRFLDTTVKDTATLSLLQEYVGYSLIQTRNLGKMLFLTGPGGTGKSTFIEVMSLLHYNAFPVDPAQLDGHSLEGLEEATLIVAAESDGRIQEQLLKKLVTGDPIKINPKGKKMIDLKNQAKIIFACNELPRITDSSSGYWRRQFVVPFNNIVTEDDKKLDIVNSIMYNEMDLLVTWAIEGLIRIVQNNWKFSESEEVSEFTEAYKVDTNSALSFIEGLYFSEDNDFSFDKNLFFEHYREDCQIQGKRPYSTSKFWKIITEHIKLTAGFDISTKQKRECGKILRFLNIRISETPGDKKPAAPKVDKVKLKKIFLPTDLDDCPL